MIIFKGKELLRARKAYNCNHKLINYVTGNLRHRTIMLLISVTILIPLVATIVTANAAMRKTLTPRISIEEQYDDNIDLEAENEDSDWITLVLPGFSIDLEGPRTLLNLDYEAGFSFYRDDSSRDSTRHRGEVSWEQDLASHLTMNISDTFTRSEDPIVESEGVIEDIQTRRRVFYRNTGEASLSYAFGAEDQFTVGYRNRYLDDRSSEDDDSTGHEGFAGLDKWFGPRYGLSLTPHYNRGKFENDDDFKQYGSGVRLNYRWRPDRLFYVRYEFLDHDFDDPATATERNDYKVHDEAMGLDFALGPNTNLLIEAGYYSQDYDNGDSTDGFSYSGAFGTSTQKASFNLQASGGHDQDYYSDENLGSSEFRQISGSADYLLAEDLRAFASGSYRREEFFGADDQEDRQDDLWRVTGGVSLSFWRWMTLSLEATHSERDSDDPSRDFEDNRAMFRITAAYPVRL